MHYRIIFILIFFFNLSYTHEKELSITHNQLEYLKIDLKKEVVDLIKHFESYTPISHWDICAYRWGYGTTTTKAGLYISEKQAFNECQRNLDKRIKIIQTTYPHLNEWQTMMIAAFKYNVNNFQSGLIAAITTGDNCLIAKEIAKYNKAGGRFYKSLNKRRNIEIEYLLSDGDYTKIMQIKTKYNI